MAELKRDSVRALEEIVGQMNKAREVGNNCFKAQLFDEACRWYTECIIIGVEKLQEIEENFSLYSWSTETYEAGLYEIRKSLNLAKSNRSEVYLQQGDYESALADAEHYLEYFDANNAKALYRKGRALEGLQQFEKAYRSFEAARKLNPTDTGIQNSARRTWICFRQSEGEYDPSDYYLHEGIGNNCLDPFCEYVGPVEIELLPGRGRGLVLTRAAVAGKVLLASKALVMASDLINSLSDLAARSKMCRRKLRWLQAKPYDSEESDVPDHVPFSSGSCKSARVNTEQVPKLTTRSNTGDSVVRCYDGIDVPDHMTVSVDNSLHTNIPGKDAEDEMLCTVHDGTSTSGSSNSQSYRTGVPPMDLFRPCKLTGHRELTDNDDDDEGEEPVQKLDIQSIAQLNGFSVAEYDNLSFELRAADHPELSSRDMEGLWLLPSFLNHSCIPNCSVVIVGEDMIVRATQYIAAGEELTITYFDPFIPHKRRLISCSEWPLNFLCNCSRCRLEEIIAEPLESLNMAYQKYIDTKILDAETDASFDQRIQVRFLSAAGMTCDAFVRHLDAVMSNISDEIHRSWIRASYHDVYCGQAAELPTNSNARIDSLKQVVEASMAVECTDTIGLRYYTILVREVGNYHGKGSNDFAELERNFVEGLRVGYGVEKRSSALKLIEKLQSISF